MSLSLPVLAADNALLATQITVSPGHPQKSETFHPDSDLESSNLEPISKLGKISSAHISDTVISSSPPSLIWSPRLASHSPTNIPGPCDESLSSGLLDSSDSQELPLPPSSLPGSSERGDTPEATDEVLPPSPRPVPPPSLPHSLPKCHDDSVAAGVLVDMPIDDDTSLEHPRLIMSSPGPLLRRGKGLPSSSPPSSPLRPSARKRTASSEYGEAKEVDKQDRKPPKRLVRVISHSESTYSHTCDVLSLLLETR